MPQLRWKLFDLFGIPVMIDLTFGIILLMFVNSGSSFPIGLAMALILGGKRGSLVEKKSKK